MILAGAPHPRFRSFVMFAEMRTGSNFLEANLNALEGVSCLGEMFNPHFIGRKDQTEAFGITLAEREADPLALLHAIRAQGEGLTGFRYFHDHDPRLFEPLMEDHSCAKIILTRNPAESYVSLKIAQATGQWKLTNVKNLRHAKARFDAAEFERHLQDLQQFQLKLLHRLQSTGQTAFYLDYEDIQDIAVLNGLAAWLGVSSRLEAPDDRLKKQNPGALSDKLENPEEMAAALAQADRFNLTRSPNFEPRRAAMVPSFIAAKGAGILLMPMPGTAAPQLLPWLAALRKDGGPEPGTESGFSRSALRQWKRDNPLHRSFTLLRHPLLRAHQAFLTLIAHKRPEQRKAFTRIARFDLPPPGQDFADPGQHREAFLAYLTYARRVVAGQTSQRPEGRIASQTAVLQGFAGVVQPDLILREEDLSAGLAFLAASFGISAPEVTLDPGPARALAAILTPDCERACEEAYGRDYQGFGFGAWVPPPPSPPPPPAS